MSEEVVLIVVFFGLAGLLILIDLWPDLKKWWKK